ncbi:MAG: pyruvate kinase [Planctomycetota bacterium]
MSLIEAAAVSSASPSTDYVHTESPIRTRIVATLGPASDSPEMVERLIQSGVNVFRFNFSHGTLEEQAKRLNTVREVSARLGTPTAALGDLQGPKIRIGRVVPQGDSDKGVELTPGQDVIFRRGVKEAFVAHDGVAVFGVTYEDMMNEVVPGQRVLVNDGAIRMLALECDAAKAHGELRMRVTVGGLVTSGKGINLPESVIKAPAITDRDWACVEFAVAQQMDFLALSFVRKADEVLELKERLKGMCAVRPEFGREAGGAYIPVISKIEKPQAVENIESIVEASDAVMVARGDLGVEMDIARTPVIQKRIVQVCRDYGKPCIIATQMLETMIENSSPTRAEASDVANAIFDRADAVMLSGETAVGAHPALVVDTMRHIAQEAEDATWSEIDESSPSIQLVRSKNVEAAIAHGVWHVARDLDAKLVVCWSEVGRIARFLSQNRMPVPIVAYSSSRIWTRRMALLSNVSPIRREPPESGRLSDWTDEVEHDLLERNWVKPGDLVVLAAGKPLGNPRAVNTIATLVIGDPSTGFRSHDR